MIPFIPDELPEVAQLPVSHELPNAECRQISWRESRVNQYGSAALVVQHQKAAFHLGHT